MNLFIKNKILILLFLCLLTYLIFNINYRENKNILIIGNVDILNTFNNDINVDTFLYDNINFKELILSLNNNDKKIIKGKNVYLNQMIHYSKYIIINTNDSCYGNSLIDFNRLVNKISKMSSSKILVVKRKCNFYNNVDENVEYIDFDSINTFIFKSNN